MVSCGTTERSDSSIITTSIPPFEYFVKAIAGDGYQVNVIVPPGASPATFEPTPSVIKGLNKSELLILDGYLGYETAWGDKLQSVNPGIATLTLANNQNLISGEAHDHGDHQHSSGVDPHFWISPPSAAIMASDIFEFLVKNYPGDSILFRDNYNNLASEINSVHNYVDSLLGGTGSRAFMIFHPALSYLARDYGLEQIAVEIEGKEPSPSDLKELIDHARLENIGVIFVQREFDRKNAEAIASEIGAEVVEIDPLSADWANSVRLDSTGHKQRFREELNTRKMANLLKIEGISAGTMETWF
ncbi:MAG: zinc ABC transporter substrate-binding protein [Bacteroidales bacterium]